MAPGGTPSANMRLLGGPACTGHRVLYPLWPPRAQQARDRLLSLGHPRREQGPDGTRAPPGQPHRGADLQNQRVMGRSPPCGVKGKGHTLDSWPRLHQGPMGLPSWTESFLLPRAQPGSSLSQPLDSTLGNSVFLAQHSQWRRCRGPQDLRGWVLGTSPIKGVPTSPKASDPHWCLRGGSGRTQKKRRGSSFSLFGSPRK